MLAKSFWKLRAADPLVRVGFAFGEDFLAERNRVLRPLWLSRS